MDDSTISLQCKVCCKKFTGAVPAKQHFSSQEHKKKESYKEAARKSDSATFCTTCNKACNTPQMLHIHSQSPRHLAQLEKQKSLFKQQNATSAIAKSSFGVTALHSTPIKQKDDSGYTFDGLRGFCHVCNIDLTSNAHKRDHVNGKPHQKRLALWRSTNQGTHWSSSGAQGDNFSARNKHTLIDSHETESQKSQDQKFDRCGVAFTCELSKSQHFASEKHRNKVKKMEMHATGPNTLIRCNACNMDLHDERFAEEHFRSPKHKLNEDNIKLQTEMVTQSSHGSTSYACGDLISQQRDSQSGGAANQCISETNIIVKPLLKVEMHEHVNNTQTVRLENSHDVDGSRFCQLRGNTQLLIEPISCSLEHEESLSETKIIQEMRSLNCDLMSSKSDIDESPVKYIWNDLRWSSPCGRGSYLWNLNKQQTEVIPGKKVNFNNGVNHQSSVGEINLSITSPKTVYGSETDCYVEDRDLSFLTKYRETTKNLDDKTNAIENTTNSCKPFEQQETILPQMPLHRRRSSSEAAGSSNNDDYYFSNEINRGHCYICNLELTSRNHMSQHVTGKNHCKAKEVHRQMDKNQNLQICTIDTVMFTGTEAKQQHMESDKHKNKERILQAGVHEFYCANCKIVCSGQGNYQQHLSGAQHRKMTGVVVPDVIVGTHNTDKTQWYLCNICGCQMNTIQQLNFHEQSPSHLAKLKRQQTGNAVMNGDQTIWYTCDICNCKMNTRQQLQIHEQSPKHLEKLRKISPVTQQVSPQQQFTKTPLTLSTSNHGYALGDNLLSPLESFLSLELFPEEFLPKSVSESKSKLPSQGTFRENVKPFELQITTERLPWTECFVSNCNSPVVSAANASSHVGSTKQGPCSDLACATRLKGTSEDKTSKPTSSGSQLSNDTEFSRHGSRPKDNCLSAAIVNPYAATHQFYCHTCKVPMNSVDSYKSHLKGQKHMAQVCVEPAPARTHPSPTVNLLSHDCLPPYTKSCPRNYQIELFVKAMSDNTLCFLPTGTGKTQVAALTISAMLQKCPTKNVLFLVDKVLLVLQQAKYLRNELEEGSFKRFDPDSESCTSTVNRHIRIAAVCMGQQSTGGVPLWKHDIVVVTAAFCQNLLEKRILRWEDFSLVVFDEAHHCEKGHPFNSLLTLFHRPIQEQCRKPKILGLTASPAGKADVPKTVQMLETLISNMGDVRMNVVEDKHNLQSLTEIQSNSEMIIRPTPGGADIFEIKLKHEFNVYITHCVVKLLCISNIKYYVNLETLNAKMDDNEIQDTADSFVDSNLDEIQSSLNSIDLQNPNNMTIVQFAFFRNHVQSICMALNSLEEGGTHCALEEIVELEKTGSNFNFAIGLGMPTVALQSLLFGHSSGMFEYLNGQDRGDIHLKRLLDELTDIPITGDKEDQKRISLVLVKQRSTVHHLTSVLQKSKRMLKLGLNTGCVVGHGGGGSSEKGMSVNQQKHILEDIKEYKYQVVVATSVAEEGVDWPECERVISMYPPSTVTALVQMRGRARRKNSKFIVLCENAKEEETLHDILLKEQNMIEATNILVQQSQMK